MLKSDQSRARFSAWWARPRISRMSASPTSKEDDRDYTGSLDRIITRLREQQDKGTRDAGGRDRDRHRASRSRRAIKDSNLDAFERFASESWTSDRVRKLVLDRTYIDLDPLLERKYARPCPHGGGRRQDSGRRASGLSPDLRDVRVAGSQPRRQPVHPAPLSGDVGTGGRADAGNCRHAGRKRRRARPWRITICC